MEKINVTNIPEAMLRNLYARAKESKRPNSFVKDEIAEQIIAQADYDFSPWEKEVVLGRGAIARTILLDKLVRDYIKKNPDATIINLACGVDTRFYRVDNGRIRWYGLDLAETVAACERIMPSSERLSYIGKSAMDESWAEDVQAEGPVLVLAESLSMYLEKQDVQKIFKIIRNRFQNAEVMMEIVMPYVVEHSTTGRGENNHRKYSFGVKNGRKLAEMLYDFKYVKQVSLLAGLKKMYPSYYVMQFLPAMRRMSNKIAILRRV